MMSRSKTGVRAKLFGGFAAVSVGFVVALVLGWVSIGDRRTLQARRLI
jgi:hypothetical protein